MPVVRQAQIQHTYRAYQVRTAAGRHRTESAGGSVSGRTVRDAAAGVVAFHAAGDALAVDGHEDGRHLLSRLPAKVARHIKPHGSAAAVPARPTRLLGEAASAVG